jgi:hypothetical protein
MIVVVVVAVMVVGIVARLSIMPMLASAIVLVGVRTVVVTATPVTVGMNDRYVQAKGRQGNDSDHQGDG